MTTTQTTPTVALRGVATISFWADDLDEATRWYTALLGTEPYFRVPGYVEFRLGDDEDELGIIDRAFAPPDLPTAPGGAITMWHVDDLDATYEALLARGASSYQPPTPRGDQGFATAAVVDPFGNVLGVMANPHWRARHEAPAA